MYLLGKSLSFGSKVSSWIGAICIVLMMLHVTLDVAGRYLFSSPLPGTIVIVANYYMILLVFLGLGVAEEKRAHISVEFLTEMMSKRVQFGLSILTGLFSAAVLTIVLMGGWSEAIKKTSGGATMEQGSQMISVWQSYWAVPIGAALMAAIATYRALTQIFGLRSGLDETDPSNAFASEHIHE